jgi:DNA repair protein RadD
MSTFTSGSPGLSLNKLISGAKVSDLQPLLDPQVLSMLQGIAPDLVKDKQFADICVKLINPHNLLALQKTRAHVIQLLPENKAIELLDRLSIERTSNVYSQLIEYEYEKKELLKLYEFFGVVDEERVPKPAEEEIQKCQVSYGLFSHQRNVVHRVEIALSDYPGKALLHMPTGAGKTRTAMNLVARHLAKNEPTLICWMAQSAELLEQAAQEFQRAWQYIGNRELPIYRYWGKYTPDLSEARDGILIGGFSKLFALYQKDANMVMRLGDRSSFLVVDEAHQAIAPTYRKIIELIHSKKPSNRLLGLSATPGRTWNDVEADAKLSEFFDSKKITLEIPGYEDPVSYLIKEGYLAKPTFRLIENNSKSLFDTSDVDGDYSPELLDQIGANIDRNQLIIAEAEALIKKHNRVILFATSVIHAKLMVAILAAKGHDAELILGETPSSSRERIIRKFKNNDPAPKILCNFGVLTTGFDAPKTSGALIARPTKSLVLYSQMVGRAIRGLKQGGNASAEIVTVVDPELPGFGDIASAFLNWEDVW